ncbi:MAG: DUF4340 domain-containing protein [Oscillospiraceae bacterium]|nr:DUF4340 domain-containing protein [Oscillospiraceae bacterium]
MNEAKEVRLVFNPGKHGTVGLHAVITMSGDRAGALPQPTRRGYTFLGWYTVPDGAAGGEHINSSTVIGADAPETLVLYAHWKKSEKAKKSSLLTQTRAIIALVVAAVVLVGGLVLTNYIVQIYRYEDADGTVYTIRKKGGSYGLYRKDGSPCDTNDEGYYLTSFGTQLEVDAKSGEYEVYAVVDVEGTEVLGNARRVLAFKQLTYDKSSTTDYSRVIRSIEVHNQQGVLDLYRPDGVDTNRFVIRGHEGTAISDELFAQLSSGCGYTISMQRLENPVRLADGSIKYAEYGLAKETRVKTDKDGKPVLDENGKEVTYEYTPTWYTVRTLQPDARTGVDSYTMTLGDATISGAGYYARYEGRDTVYILSSTNLEVALQPIESLVTGRIVYPMTLNTYFNVRDFVLRTDIHYDRILLHMAAELAGILDEIDLNKVDLNDLSTLTDAQRAALREALDRIDKLDEKQFTEMYDRGLELYSRKVTAFSYVDMEQRENSLYSSYPYRMATAYMAGYRPNADNISKMLQNLYSMSFDAVKALGPTAEQLQEYGLSEPAFDISFVYTDADGVEHGNHVTFSAKTAEGKYYAFADDYDMIVEIDESMVPFLSWKDIDWYDRDYFQYNIAHIKEIRLDGTAIRALDSKYRTSAGDVVFRLDNTASDQSGGTNSDKLVSYINGLSMAYEMELIRVTGTPEMMTGTDNFRRFVQSLLTASIEGEAGLTAEEMASLRTTDDSDCYLKITFTLDDGQKDPQKANLVYRFYRISERRCYMTVETLATPDAPSSPENGQGMFCVLRSFCDKLAADVTRLYDRIQVYPDSKN